ncbi:hypothetical protein CSB93_4173 [Pseudomonas paraeruginosa]|uniref:Uncharacterized protein n=1 Tax=Pseudomonas paraeruginosa TaxID=2994495 RepID=A0A2R3ISH7_9PSED|nr:hypothetical protein CSB93_4173 [Pseudomonas paraeruginosa]AWE89485.1 hypothetical protein CSC28_2958 [Pseudomonas paraeruginosa]
MSDIRQKNSSQLRGGAMGWPILLQRRRAREIGMGCPQVCAGATLQCSFGARRVAAEPHPSQRDAGGERHGPSRC